MDKGQQDERRERLREQLQELMTDAVDLVNAGGIDDAQTENACLLALVHAHPLNRIANALESLERIAGAMEAAGAEGTQPDAAKQKPAVPADSSSAWRSDRPSWEDSVCGFVEIPEGGRLAMLATGEKFRVNDFWAIGAADHWRPIASVAFYFVEEPASTPTTAPQEPPAGDPDTLVLGTSRERCTGDSEALQGEGDVQDVPEGAQGGQEGPVAASGGHPLDQGGWIRSRLPAEGDATANGDVKVPGRREHDWRWCPRHVVTPGQPWAPATTEPSPYTPQPLPAHLAYPMSKGWIHSRVPGPEDGDEDGDVVVADDSHGAYAHWSHVVPGQPWQRTT